LSSFPVRCPRSGGTLQAPLCPPPRPVQESVWRTKEIRKENKEKKKKARRRTSETAPQVLLLACGFHEGGRG